MTNTFDGGSLLENGDSSATAQATPPSNKGTLNGPKEFEEPMRIYGQSFKYRVANDTLRLFSKEVKLWAVRDRTIDDLLKPISPKYRR